MNIKDIKNRISEDRIDEAIRMLKIGVSPKSTTLNEVYLIESRIDSLKKLIRKGTISNSETQIEKNKIANSLLEVIDQIDSNEFSDEFESKKGLSNKLTKLGFIFSVLGVVAAIAGFVADLSQFNLFGDNNSITLIVHGIEGREQKILENEGEIALITGNLKMTSQIDENGKVTFNDIPSELLGEKFIVNIEGTENEYKILGEKEFSFKKKKTIYLPVSTEFTLKGIIVDSNSSMPLENVTVQINDTKALSNNAGVFSLNIPIEKEGSAYRIYVTKEGYQPYTTFIVPNKSNSQYDIRLKKE